MSHAGQPVVLKHNVKRTVSLVREGPDLCVVKRFHAPSRLDRWKDPLRAVREARALRRLRRRGLPVPRPLAIRRREGCWELVLEHLDGVDLERVLAGNAPWPAPPARVAFQLGRLLGTLHAASVALPDLHAGNVLVGADGAVALVDVARVGGGRPRAARDLASLAAGVRESTTARFRARVFLASGLGGPRSAGRARLVDGIELAARTLRRDRVLARTERWWRESGDTRALDAFGCRGWVARSVDDETCTRVLRDHATALAPVREVERVAGPQARERWNLAARLAMHGLPGEEPLLVTTSPELAAFVARPAGARPFEVVWRSLGGVDRSLLAHAAGTVLGGLDDRGLALAPAGGSELLATPAGRVLIGPAETVSLVRPDPFGVTESFFAELSPRPRTKERAAFAMAFVDAHRSTRAERHRLERELAGA